MCDANWFFPRTSIDVSGKNPIFAIKIYTTKRKSFRKEKKKDKEKGKANSTKMHSASK